MAPAIRQPPAKLEQELIPVEPLAHDPHLLRPVSIGEPPDRHASEAAPVRHARTTGGARFWTAKLEWIPPEHLEWRFRWQARPDADSHS